VLVTLLSARAQDPGRLHLLQRALGARPWGDAEWGRRRDKQFEWGEARDQDVDGRFT
jgi:hypothetical protein